MTDAVHLQELVGGRLRRRLAQARPAGLLLAWSGHGAAAAEAEHLLDLLGGVHHSVIQLSEQLLLKHLHVSQELVRLVEN